MAETARGAVLVTGGGSGMGRAIAGAFAQAGRPVVIVGRRVERLRETAAALGPTVTWRQADVSQSDQVATSVASVVEAYHHIDVLVNAAGFARGVSADMPLDVAEQAWDDTVGTNLKGAFLMALAVAPHLARPGGRIINISSIAAYTGGSRGGAIDYAAAKAGVLGLTVGLARDLSPQGITVNAIAPGFIAETGFTGSWSRERIAQIVAETPVRRPGQVDDISAAALYLAAPEAAFVTGQVLHVNGGWLFGH
jgi:3-oxoacyl-[acyl-carrier protein] reductase